MTSSSSTKAFRKARWAYIAFLKAAHGEAPSEFEAWLLRLLDAASAAYPGVPAFVLRVLFLVFAWGTADIAFSRDVLAGLRKVDSSSLGDPLLAAARLLFEVTEQAPLAIRRTALRAVFRSTDLDDHRHLIQIIRVEGPQTSHRTRQLRVLPYVGPTCSL